jgi:copper(I)-binding protein
MIRLSALALAALLAAVPAIAARAADADAVRVSHAWLRILPGELPAGGYAVLQNTGDAPLALVGASSAAYGHVMLHQSSQAGGMSRMSMVESLPLPPHGKATLAPGGYHLMMMHATRQVRPGETVKVQLRFADGSTLDADFLARPANATDDTR